MDAPFHCQSCLRQLHGLGGGGLLGLGSSGALLGGSAFAGTSEAALPGTTAAEAALAVTAVAAGAFVLVGLEGLGSQGVGSGLDFLFGDAELVLDVRDAVVVEGEVVVAPSEPTS